jgi:hypothetical protein
MRLHRRVTRLHMRGKHDGDLWRFTALFPPTFERKAHGIRVRHIALQRIENRELQSGFTVLLAAWLLRAPAKPSAIQPCMPVDCRHSV